MRLSYFSASLAFALLLASCGGGNGGGATPPRTTVPTLALSPVVSGLTNPLGMESSHDSTGRLFILQQGGIIRILQNGSLNAAPFLDITSLVESGGEKGLLGLAFHPNFSTNRKFYVNYTRRVAGQLQTIVAEYQASTANPNQADTSSARILLTINQPFDNHNGGQLAFGPDGFLYIGVGDGGSGGDPNNNGQNKTVLLGKLLRIDVNSTSAGKQYAIPPGNPFASGVGGAPEIFAYGFRNPWRFSFDSSRLFVADVGQDAFEEIDLVESGKNYGWRVMEGTHCFNPASNCDQTGLTLPIFDYPHSDGESVTGGFVYRGSAIPALVGTYVFADFISGNIWLLNESGSTWTRTLAIASGRGVSSFGRDDSGEIYVVDYSGSILRLVAQ
jgi:glucose/arabinose dehydrogenase